MEIIGIIAEYNPFHNGHIYHINKIKEMYKNSIIIAVISSSFTQRGDVSLINKWNKTSIALDNKVDIVVELPYCYSVQSADLFAYASVKILNELGVKKIVFGSESNNTEELKKIAESTIGNKEFDEKVKEYLNQGLSYPISISKATFDITGNNISTPNDILGLSYIKEIIINNYDITPISIKRTNDYNSSKISGDISSATSIRKHLEENKDISNFIPEYDNKYIYDINKIKKNYFELLKYKILSSKDLSIYNTVDEGIENKIIKNITTSNNLDEFVEKIKSKRYTYAKMKRMLTHILCDFTKEDMKNTTINYIRILGFNQSGKKYLSNIKKNTTIPLITTYNKLLNNEKKITSIYSLLVEDNSLIEIEYKNRPIIR